MNRSITSLLLLTTLNTTMWTGCLVFILVHLVETEEDNSCFLSSLSDPGRKFSHLRKVKYVWLQGMLELVLKALQHSFSSSFIACDKNWLFLILYDKYQMFSCTTLLIRNPDTPMSLATDLTELLGSLSVMASISATHLEVLSFSE